MIRKRKRGGIFVLVTIQYFDLVNKHVRTTKGGNEKSSDYPFPRRQIYYDTSNNCRWVNCGVIYVTVSIVAIRFMRCGKATQNLHLHVLQGLRKGADEATQKMHLKYIVDAEQLNIFAGTHISHFRCAEQK